MHYLEKYRFWLKNKYFDQEAKAELKSIEGNDKEIEDRFYKDLEFGTGGLRGKIGMGTNRMNIYTVSRATQGLASYLFQKGPSFVNRGVVIAYDSRHKSPEFAKTAALVLAANNIKTFLFEDLRSTPELSFAVRYLQASAGIVITASHNPPQYSGYKVYGPDGGQIIPEIADQIIACIDRINDYSTIKKIDEKTAIQKGLFKIIGQEVDDTYINKIKELTLRDGHEIDKEIKIVYTPLHGTGNIAVRRILKERGFKNIYIVKEQEKPDPNFSTVAYPNPEDPAAFKLAIHLGQKVGAQIIIATDPDCDRIGVAVRNKSTDQFTILTGNQVGALLLEYILSSKKAKNELPPNGVIIKTIVTSELGRVIATAYGLITWDTLTGFKFIGHKIKEMEEQGDKQFVFGYEESLGYLAGDFVRDKDAVIAAMLICEMASYYQKNGLNLLQVLNNIYQKYGYYIEGLKFIELEGAEGEKKINDIMEAFRDKVPEIKNMDIAKINDYQSRKSFDYKSKTTTLIDLPPSNVIKVIFSDGSWYVLRPSGTEPKIKIYMSFCGKTKKAAQQKLHLAKSTIFQKINSIIKYD
ncbi:MAG: phospho-sugar mutase [Candidatus Atribacteria bacterium]